MQTPLYVQLKAAMEAIAFSLVETPAKDFATYLERVGMYNGINKAIEIIEFSEKEDV